MKMIRWICLLLVFVLGYQNLWAQKKTKEEKKQEMKEFVERSVEAHTFKIDASIAYPMRGRSIPLTGSYSLELKNDSADVYLPYYGRAYNIPYGGGKGLVFKAPVKDFTTDLGKGKYTVSFSTSNDEDTFDFVVKIYDGGSANISVTMRNRTAISYSGSLDATGLQ